MKNAMFVVASILCVSACNKGPTVDLKNASGNQVAQAVKQSGVMNSDTMIEPGLWQSKTDVQEMNMPGMPPEFAAKMRQGIAESRNQSSSHCVTAEEVKKPKEDFFGADKSCKYQHFTMGAGKIDAKMVCNAGGSTQTTSLSGTYTSTSYSMDVSSSGTGGPQNGMSMKLHVSSKRVGECTGKEG